MWRMPPSTTVPEINLFTKEQKDKGVAPQAKKAHGGKWAAPVDGRRQGCPMPTCNKPGTAKGSGSIRQLSTEVPNDTEIGLPKSKTARRRPSKGAREPTQGSNRYIFRCAL